MTLQGTRAIMDDPFPLECVVFVFRFMDRINTFFTPDTSTTAEPSCDDANAPTKENPRIRRQDESEPIANGKDTCDRVTRFVLGEYAAKKPEPVNCVLISLMSDWMV